MKKTDNEVRENCKKNKSKWTGEMKITEEKKKKKKQRTILAIFPITLTILVVILFTCSLIFNNFFITSFNVSSLGFISMFGYIVVLEILYKREDLK